MNNALYMLKVKLNEDLKEAMRAKDALKTGVLRMLIGAMRNKEISLRKGDAVELSDEQALEVVSSEIKKRRDSCEAYEKGGRNDLAEQEKSEAGILSAYLPAQLTDDELEKIAMEAVASLPEGANFGQAMGAVMPKVKGKADGSRISAAVKKAIEGR
jgi:uncharacterized protein